jgi:hypothetical protein
VHSADRAPIDVFSHGEGAYRGASAGAAYNADTTQKVSGGGGGVGTALGASAGAGYNTARGDRDGGYAYNTARGAATGAAYNIACGNNTASGDSAGGATCNTARCTSADTACYTNTSGGDSPPSLPPFPMIKVEVMKPGSDDYACPARGKRQWNVDMVLTVLCLRRQ